MARDGGRAVDIHILVYAEIVCSEHHETARRLPVELRNLLHDAHIATLCIEHGIGELVTGDRDFARFPLRVTNPFG